MTLRVGDCMESFAFTVYLYATYAGNIVGATEAISLLEVAAILSPQLLRVIGWRAS